MEDLEKIRIILNEGIVLGLKEAKKALNLFLDEKKEKYGKLEYISRNELNVFMDAYIGCEENENKFSTTKNT